MPMPMPTPVPNAYANADAYANANESSIQESSRINAWYGYLFHHFVMPPIRILKSVGIQCPNAPVMSCASPRCVCV